MLPSQRRDQTRWTQSVGRLEDGTNQGIVALLSAARKRATALTNEIGQEAQSRPDPQFYIAQNAERINAEIGAAYLAVPREEVGLVIGAAAESAYLLGVSEGGKRVRRVAQRTPTPVPQDVQEEQRSTQRRNAEAGVDDWVNTTARSAGASAVRSLFVVAAGATVASSMLYHDKYRTALLSRNSLVGAGRTGMASSYGVNGMGAWIWMAAQTACEICWGKQGLVFPASVPLESHINCRCSQEPAASTDAQGFDADRLFSTLPASQQVRVLGPGKHELWKSKQISLRDIPNGNKARTLRELRQ